MSVIIRGVRFPKSCAECWELRGTVCLCSETGRKMFCARGGFVPPQPEHEKRRGDNCPLMPLKTPHGRLGDLDKLTHIMEWAGDTEAADIIKNYKEAVRPER